MVHGTQHLGAKTCEDLVIVCRSILHLLSSFSVTTEIGCPTLLVLARTALPGAFIVFLLLLVTLDRDNIDGYA